MNAVEINALRLFVEWLKKEKIRLMQSNGGNERRTLDPDETLEDFLRANQDPPSLDP